MYIYLFINLLVILLINPKVVTSIKCPRTQSDVFKCSSVSNQQSRTHRLFMNCQK